MAIDAAKVTQKRRGHEKKSEVEFILKGELRYYCVIKEGKHICSLKTTDLSQATNPVIDIFMAVATNSIDYQLPRKKFTLEIQEINGKRCLKAGYERLLKIDDPRVDIIETFMERNKPKFQKQLGEF